MRGSRLAAFVVAAVLGVMSARARATESQPPATGGGKSPWLAATLAGGTALVGYGTLAGLSKWNDADPAPVVLGSAVLGLFGPAAGHIYVGRNAHHAAGFAAARVGFVAVGFLGLGGLMANDDGQTHRKVNKPLGYTLLGVAITGVVGSTVWEAIDSYRCAQLTAGPPQRTVALSPFLLPSSTGALASGGLVLSGTI